MVNTFDRDNIGLQLTICDQTGCYAEQLESWFDALFFEALLMYLRARSTQSALALLFSVSEETKTAEME